MCSDALPGKACHLSSRSCYEHVIGQCVLIIAVYESLEEQPGSEYLPAVLFLAAMASIFLPARLIAAIIIGIISIRVKRFNVLARLSSFATGLSIALLLLAISLSALVLDPIGLLVADASDIGFITSVYAEVCHLLIYDAFLPDTDCSFQVSQGSFRWAGYCSPVKFLRELSLCPPKSIWF